MLTPSEGPGSAFAPRAGPIHISKAEARIIIKEFTSNPYPNISLKDGTVQLSKGNSVYFKISVDDFVKTIDHYHLKNLLKDDLYKHLKSVRDEINSKSSKQPLEATKTSKESPQTPTKQDKPQESRWATIFSAGFDDYSGVSRTQAHDTGIDEAPKKSSKPHTSEDKDYKSRPKPHFEKSRKVSKAESHAESQVPTSLNPLIEKKVDQHRKDKKIEKEKEKEVDSTEKEIPKQPLSSVKKAKAEFTQESEKRFKQEMDNLFLILACVKDSKNGLQTSENLEKLASELQIDETTTKQVVQAYAGFQDKLDLESLKKIMKKNSLNSEEIVLISKQLGLDNFLENDVHQFINKPEKFLLTIQILCLTQQHYSLYFEGATDKRLLSLSEEKLKILLQTLFRDLHPMTKDSARNLLIKKFITLQSLLPPSELSQLIDLDYFCIPALPKDFDFSKGYVLPKGVDLKIILEEKQKSYTWQEFFFLASTSPDEVSLVQNTIKRVSTSVPDEVALSFVVRKSNWALENYKIDQKKFGSKMHEGVLAGVELLHENRWDFTQHLRFLEYWRMDMANLSKERGPTFGLLNCIDESRMHTPCDEKSPYEGLGKKLPRLIEKWKSEENPFLHEGKGNLIPIPSASKEDFCYIEYNCRGKIVQLSTFALAEDGRVKSIIHPLFDAVPPILDYVSDLYKDSLKEENQEKLLHNLGKIFWLLCQAKPWLRGDPSIAEMLIKTIWRHNTGKDMPAWKADLIPWERVIEYSNPDDFANDFALMFAQSPLLS